MEVVSTNLYVDGGSRIYGDCRRVLVSRRRGPNGRIAEECCCFDVSYDMYEQTDDGGNIVSCLVLRRFLRKSDLLRNMRRSRRASDLQTIFEDVLIYILFED